MRAVRSIVALGVAALVATGCASSPRSITTAPPSPVATVAQPAAAVPATPAAPAVTNTTPAAGEAARFCSTMSSEKARILRQMNVTAGAGGNDEGLTAVMQLVASVQALGELRTYFHKLADTAPEEIRTEAEIVAKGYDDQFAKAQELPDSGFAAMAQLAALFVAGIATSGQLNTVDQYAVAHCGEHV